MLSFGKRAGAKLGLLSGAALVVLINTAGYGQSSGAPPVPPDSALAVALRTIGGAPLTLEEAMARAESEASETRIARADLASAEASVLREKGLFDPELFARLERSRTEQPTASFFAGADVLEEEVTDGSAGARMTLPFGTELEASLGTTRSETNSTFVTLSPQESAESQLSIRQPLLKGLGPGTRGPLSAAERRLAAAQARWEDARSAAHEAVEANYWELYAAERDLAVQLVIVETAEAILEQAERRSAAGLVGPQEVASARVFLAEQKLLAIDREEELDQISDAMATRIGQRPVGAMRFHAASVPPSAFAVEDEEELVTRALANNPELRAVRQDLESARALARAARWNALPALDLVGSLGGRGLGGDPTSDSLEVAHSGSLSDAASDAVSREYPTWSVGVELSVPLFLREGRGEREENRAAVRRLSEELVDAERSTADDVRARARELVRGNERLALAQDGVAAAREQIRIGVIQYENGQTTAFELVRLGADLAAAQQRFSDSIVRTATAAAALRRLLGAPLSKENP